MTTKRPWNRIDSPVYSIATRSQTGVANMNICTYVTAVSLKPKIYSISIYKGSKTFQNVQQGSPIVLQLLARDQLSVVRRLGLTSGHTGDKLHRLKVTEFQSLNCLQDALAWIALEPTAEFDTGDHVTYICAVLAWHNQSIGEPLMLNDLRLANIIRA